jgi:paraquat-inducible protein B
MTNEEPEAAVIRQHRFAMRLPGIWLVPIVAALIALYLGYRNFAHEGPEITISFNTAEGIAAGQTQVKYRAVPFGTVTGVTLNPRTRDVDIQARMTKQAAKLLTSHSRFWVVRPRLDSGSLAGFETIISGAYIQFDPGPPGGDAQDSFKGLEDPPGRTYDEPGKTYIVQTERIGPVNKGSVIFYRDVNVGEVLSYDIGDGFGPIRLSIFVRAPYDQFVRPGTRFWNASGFGIEIGAEGFRMQLQSLQSILAGGIDFETPEDQKNVPPVEEKSVFTLYANQESAEEAMLRQRVPYVTYFETSVKGLPVGAPVTLYGIRVGTVKAVTLIVDQKTALARVRVDYQIEPKLAFKVFQGEMPDTLDLTRRMVQNGLRARLGSSNLLTGQQMISLEFVPNAKPAEVTMDGTSILMPAGPENGIQGITDAAADVAAKLDQIPFADIGQNLNNLLAHADRTVNGPDMRNALHSLSVTLTEAQSVVRKADQGLTPALQRLPEISAQLQQAATRANSTLASVDQNSDLQHEAHRTLEEVDNAARSIGLLADFLDRHPEALVRGRATKETQ